MLLPCMLFVIVFNYIPMAGVVLAFKNYSYKDGIFGSAWSGWNNFRFLFLTDKIWTLTRNTLLYNLAFIIVELIMEIGVAVLMNELGSKWFKKTFQSFMFLPHFISWVVAVAVVQVMFSYDYGLVNEAATLMGLERLNISTNPDIWPVLLVMLHAWKKVGYGSIVYMAAITSIDPALYEAAAMDGANI